MEIGAIRASGNGTDHTCLNTQLVQNSYVHCIVFRYLTITEVKLKLELSFITFKNKLNFNNTHECRNRLAQMVERSLRKNLSVGTRVRFSAQDFSDAEIY